MMKEAVLLMCVLSAAQPGGALAQEHGHGSQAATPYGGLQAREIKSLSAEDIEELRNGGGWGLALPAELSDRPGPAHLLALRDEIGLSDAQVVDLEALYEDMRAEAIVAGERFIAAEAALSDAFANRDLEADHLRDLVDTASAARAELRFIHLSRHLLTPDLLTAEQIRHYNFLRGYTEGL